MQLPAEGEEVSEVSDFQITGQALDSARKMTNLDAEIRSAFLGDSNHLTAAGPLRNPTMAGGTASSSTAAPAGFRGFSPPRWIFPQNLTEEGVTVAATTTTTVLAPVRYRQPPPLMSESRNHVRPNLGSYSDDEDASYGPTTRRRGNVKFVRAKLTSKESNGDKTVRDKVVNKDGTSVKKVYEGIIRSASMGTIRGKRARRPPIPIDVDLTLESSGDEITVLDPLTRLPYPPPTRPFRIHQLLPLDTAIALIPPVNYHLKSFSRGFRMLQQLGWKEGDSLGAPEMGGIKVPLKGELKLDRGGLGLGGTIRMNKKEKEIRRLETERMDRQKRGLGARGMARVAKKDIEERQRLAWELKN